MPYRNISFVQQGYYHIFNRGVFQNDVFHSKENYLYCIRLLRKNIQRFPVSVIAYCLMPNHYHFLIRQNGIDGITKFIGYSFNSYAQALNKQMKRHGSIFQGPFKAVLVDKNEYLMHVCRYIHLNPVKANLAQKPEQWTFSNYREWVNYEAPNITPSRELAAPEKMDRNKKLFDPIVLNMFFKNSSEYKQFVEDEFEEPKGLGKYLLD